MSDPIDYAKEYDNSGRVADAAELIENYVIDAAFYREQRADHADFDKRYGRNERNRMDVFWPDEGKDAPIVMFIHGGYWQRLDKSSFSHMASGLNANGVAVAIPSYTLCPENTVDGIINEMRRACILLYQSYKRQIVTVGHSAGGHLSACMMATDWVSIHPDLPEDLVCAGMGISGLYQLAPLLQTPINDALNLNEDTAHKTSPHFWVPDGLHQFEAWVGAEESDEFHRQSQELAERWSMLGTPTHYVSEREKNHFTVINPLAQADSYMVERVMELVGQPVQEVKLRKPSKQALSREMQEFETDAANIDDTIMSYNYKGETAQPNKQKAAPAEE